jgi:hypothetical protein
MKQKFHLHEYRLLGGGTMIILTENRGTGFINHRWTFGPGDII